MRFFHLSDLHLGIKLYEHDLLKDQKAILDEIVALTRQYQPDARCFRGGYLRSFRAAWSKRLRCLTTS